MRKFHRPIYTHQPDARFALVLPGANEFLCTRASRLVLAGIWIEGAHKKLSILEPQNMASSSKTPRQIAGYNVLLLSLPPLPSFPQAATHYLYMAPHQPKTPTPTASRSLFLVNVPFDSTDIHIKHLLSTQIGLPAGRIEDVQFEGQRRKGSSMDEASGSKASHNKKTKKRKRGSSGTNVEDMEGAALPSVWDRDLQTNGLTAVILFVDRASMDAALRAVKSTRKERREPVWGEGLNDKVPALGSASWSLIAYNLLADSC